MAKQNEEKKVRLFENDMTFTGKHATYMKYLVNEAQLFVRYPEGAEMYSMSLSKFQQLAKDAKACYKMNRLVLVNLDILDEYLETFHIEDEEFYK